MLLQGSFTALSFQCHRLSACQLTFRLSALCHRNNNSPCFAKIAFKTYNATIIEYVIWLFFGQIKFHLPIGLRRKQTFSYKLNCFLTGETGPENSPLMTFFNRDPFSSSDWLPFRFEFSRANSSQSEKRHRSLQNFAVSVAFLARRKACASQCCDFFKILAYLGLQMPGRLTLCGCLFLDTWRANACSPCDSSCAFVILRSYVNE